MHPPWFTANFVTYNAPIGAYAYGERAKQAMQFFEAIKARGLTPVSCPTARKSAHASVHAVGAVVATSIIDAVAGPRRDHLQLVHQRMREGHAVRAGVSYFRVSAVAGPQGNDARPT